MAGSSYLNGSTDLATYGLTVGDAQNVVRASMILDSYLFRPEGLVYLPDYLGQPTYMAALNPTSTLLCQVGLTIGPGTSVVVPINNPNVVLTSDLVGEAVIIDRLNSSATEACQIIAVAPGLITLGSVTTPHVPATSSGVRLEFGLTIKEERPLTDERSLFRATRPVVRIISGLGRYGYGRRSDQIRGVYEDLNLLAAYGTFGGPPAWIPFDVTQCGVSWDKNNQVWIPAGIYMAFYNEVRLAYVSGYEADQLPDVIKSVTAQLCRGISEVASTPNIRRQRSGTTELERFADTIITEDLKRQLRPFTAQRF